MRYLQQMSLCLVLFSRIRWQIIHIIWLSGDMDLIICYKNLRTTSVWSNRRLKLLRQEFCSWSSYCILNKPSKEFHFTLGVVSRKWKNQRWKKLYWSIESYIINHKYCYRIHQSYRRQIKSREKEACKSISRKVNHHFADCFYSSHSTSLNVCSISPFVSRQ